MTSAIDPVRRLRALSELFALAERARTVDDLAAGAVGADGFGFALATQRESERAAIMGSKLANLPSYTDAGLVAHVVGLVDGHVALRAHLEELFTLVLCAVSPSGARAAVSFYHGPSGLALGGSRDVLDRDQAAALAVSWERALRKAPRVDFQLAVGSDFGRSALVVRDGIASHPRAAPADVPAPPARLVDDPAALIAAIARGAAAPVDDPVAAFEALDRAWHATGEAARTPHARAYEAAQQALWPAALAALEAALVAGGPLAPATEAMAVVLMFPQGFRLDDDRRDRLRDAWEAFEQRRRGDAPW